MDVQGLKAVLSDAAPVLALLGTVLGLLANGVNLRRGWVDTARIHVEAGAHIERCNFVGQGERDAVIHVVAATNRGRQSLVVKAVEAKTRDGWTRVQKQVADGQSDEVMPQAVVGYRLIGLPSDVKDIRVLTTDGRSWRLGSTRTRAFLHAVRMLEQQLQERQGRPDA